MNYAHKKNIPYVLLIGEEEVSSNMMTLKDMRNGEQKKMTTPEIIEALKNG